MEVQIMNLDLLIVDDEEHVRNSLKDYFEREGFNLTLAKDGFEALEKYQLYQPDIVVLDVGLPIMDGLEICKQLRKQSGQSVGIIMISGIKKETIDRVVGLEVGADVYVTKPFQTRELLAQVRALHRRIKAQNQHGDDPGWLVVDDYLRIHFGYRKVQAGGEEIHLTPTEFSLLHLLANQPGKPFSRSDLVDLVWGYPAGGDISDSAVNTCVSKLRNKIEPEPQKPRYIISVHSIGYKFKEV
jgi:DNA-binding response OmpR family regulator